MVLGAIVSVQVGAAFAKGLFEVARPAGVVWLRLAFAAALLVAVVRPSPRVLRGPGARSVLLFGFALAVMNWSFYEALARIPLGVAVTVEFIGPLGVAVATSRRRSDLFVVAIAAAGIALLTRSGEAALDPVGVGLALLAGACWAAYILLSASVGEDSPGGAPLAVALVVGTVVMSPPGLTALWGTVTPGLLAAGAAVAMLSSAIPYSLELEALRRVPTSVFGVLMSLEPAAAAVAGAVVLGEELVPRQWVAVLLVVTASAIAALRGPVPATQHPD
jgi:inner membrane transporter RhtA